MSGVAVIVGLLRANNAITAVVPAARILAGDLPLGTTMPAISVTQISSMPMNFIRPDSSARMHTDRVQVSVLCKEPQTGVAGTGYPGLRSLMRLVLAACPNQRGTINGVVCDSIVPDLEGPDSFDDIDMVRQSSRDFIVRRF
jgi:hypothetical protein